MIESKNIAFQYQSDTQFQFPDLTCAAGQPCLVLGPSGSGKSTFLQILGGLRTPGQGTVLIENQNIFKLSQKGRDKFRGKHIGIVYQTPHFIRALNLNENLLMAQKLAGNNTNQLKIDSVLQRLNLDHRKFAKTYELSEGEKQRGNIARAVINAPKVILADEPTSALDDDNCSEVLNLLLERASEADAALIIVTHDQRLKDQISNSIAL